LVSLTCYYQLKARQEIKNLDFLSCYYQIETKKKLKVFACLNHYYQLEANKEIKILVSLNYQCRIRAIYSLKVIIITLIHQTKILKIWNSSWTIKRMASNFSSIETLPSTHLVFHTIKSTAKSCLLSLAHIMIVHDC
jgi:hypothetical protein